MDEKRLDALIEAALQTGRIPEDATPDEQLAVDALIESARQLRDIVAPAITAEARDTMPTARARFERFVAANQPRQAPAPAVAAKSGWLSWLRGGRPTAMMAGSVAGIAILLVAVAFGVGLAGGGVESAAAQVLTPGDYVQLEGVVTATQGSGADQTVTIQSDIGSVEVAVTELTSVVDESNASDGGAVRTGARVLVAGVVEAPKAGQRLIAARTLALVPGNTNIPRATKITLKQLEQRRPNLSGTVVVFTLSEDGVRGRVVIETVEGQRYLVPVDGAAVQKLVAFATVLGARVEVLRSAGTAADVFSLNVPTPSPEPSPPAATPQTTATERPSSTPPVSVTPSSPARPDAGDTSGNPKLVEVKGTFVSREAEVLTIRTVRGPLEVVLRADTRVVVGDSGIVAATLRRGELPPGTILTVSGGLERSTGRVVADVILVERRPLR